MSRRILDIDRLSVQFQTPEGVARAVEAASFGLAEGESLGLVGESGCGKSVTALSIMQLIPAPPGRITHGRIFFDGRNLLELSAEEMRQVRGRDIGMIFQEPMTSLNPVLTVGRQVAEPLMVHLGLRFKDALDQAAQWLEKVRIPAARRRLQDYPHHLSGGMRQRVMIAAALACNPRLLIADEPTTALDVTIQAQILGLIQGLQQELGTSLLLITHDLGVVAQTVRRVVVMYAGEVVEEALVRDLFHAPLHPYTLGLMRSIPRLGTRQGRIKGRLSEIPGLVPALTEIIAGCKFAARCPQCLEVCLERRPELWEIAPGRRIRCWRVEIESDLKEPARA